MRVLLVEDNPRLAATVAQGLGEDGHHVDVLDSGRAAVAAARRAEHDVVVLDLGLPDLDGVDVLRQVRASAVQVPVLVLTARDAIDSRVLALDAGADDYLVKPFAFEEMLARLRALARRAAAPRWTPLAVGDLVIGDDLSCTLDGRRVALSPREHGLLVYLLRRRGEVVTRADVLREVFGYGFDPGTNVIDVHLKHLRRKLGTGVVHIDTIRGVGFRLELDA